MLSAILNATHCTPEKSRLPADSGNVCLYTQTNCEQEDFCRFILLPGSFFSFELMPAALQALKKRFDRRFCVEGYLSLL